MTKHKRGFTLLEVLIVVIIIAVLATVAWPQYKHAVLKSRFSTVMPMAKAVADAQEVYYLGNNQYALGKEDLDIAPVEAENTQVSLSTGEEEDKYIYVAAQRTDIPDVRYIMYQKNSPKFASNIHCEAKADNDDALWLCEKGLHGTALTSQGASSIQGDDYKTFLLAGANGTGDYFSKTCSGSAEKTCSCGGPVTGSCNDETGTWVYANDCPTPDPDETGECPAGYTGSRTRHAVCENGAYVNKWTDNCKLACKDEDKESLERDCPCGSGKQTRSITGCENGTWKYTDWSTSDSCHDKLPDFIEACSAGEYGLKTYTYTCNASGTGWTAQLVSSTCSTQPLGTYENNQCDADSNNDCSGYAFEHSFCNVFGSAGCNGNHYDTGGGCFTADPDSCNGGSFSGRYLYSDNSWNPTTCYAYMGENSCSNATFNEYAGCSAYTSNTCNNNTFNSGSSCYASASNTCSGTYNGTAYCSGSYCPAGSPVSYSNGKTCWDGNGNIGAQYCNGGVTY